MKVYNLENRNVCEETTLESVKAKGLKQGSAVNVGSYHAVTYKKGGPESQPEAVAIYASSDSDFIGERI